MSDGGIDGGKYRRCRPPSSFVDNVFDCGGALSSSDCGRHRGGLVVILPLLSLHRGVLLDPDGNDNKDDDDRSHQDCVAGSCNGNVGAAPSTLPRGEGLNYKPQLAKTCARSY